MTPLEAIETLRGRGLTQADIGARVGVRQSTISRILKGREPHWTLGQDLIELARSKRCKRKS